MFGMRIYFPSLSNGSTDEWCVGVESSTGGLEWDGRWGGKKVMKLSRINIRLVNKEQVEMLQWSYKLLIITDTISLRQSRPKKKIDQNISSPS